MEPEVVVAISFNDGSVGRMQLFQRPKVDEKPEPWTDRLIQSEIDKSAFFNAIGPVAAVSWRRCELSDFPVEYNDFRAAWTDNGKSIGVDMEKARAITRDRLRMERAPLLAAKDIESIKALEAGDITTLEEIAVEKQRLRNITTLPAIEAAKTPAELKLISVSQRVVLPNRLR